MCSVIISYINVNSYFTISDTGDFKNSSINENSMGISSHKPLEKPLHEKNCKNHWAYLMISPFKKTVQDNIAFFGWAYLMIRPFKKP